MSTYISDNMNNKFPPDICKDELQRWNLGSLMLSSFSATDSLVPTIDRTLRNNFQLPFIAGPSSLIYAVFTALNVAHKMNVTTVKSSLSVSLEEIGQKINAKRE